jgi:hypothetical protein
MKYKHTAVTACYCLVSTVLPSPLFAFGNLSAEEVRALFSGQTVNGEFREGSRKHVDPNSVNTFYEPFVTYFSADGSVRSIRGGKKKTGKWRVDAKGNHCVQWTGKKEGCAPITKEGHLYKKYMIKPGGSRIKWVKTYNKFTAGNTDNL